MTELVTRITRIANRAVHKAQKENTKKGISNVYFINGQPVYQLPSGKIVIRKTKKTQIKGDNI